MTQKEIHTQLINTCAQIQNLWHRSDEKLSDYENRKKRLLDLQWELAGKIKVNA